MFKHCKETKKSVFDIFEHNYTPPKYLIKTIANRFNIDSGKSFVQENFNKSKEAILGNVALIQIVINIIKNVFKNSQKTCSI